MALIQGPDFRDIELIRNASLTVESGKKKESYIYIYTLLNRGKIL